MSAAKWKQAETWKLNHYDFEGWFVLSDFLRDCYQRVAQGLCFLTSYEAIGMYREIKESFEKTG
jgi:hypothetical protein